MFDSLISTPPEKRWRHQAQPLPIVVALIQRAAQRDDPSAGEPVYLLIRRKRDPYHNCWAMVGGKWEFGEPLATAAIREVNEETGLTAQFIALRGIVNERLAPPEGGRGEAAQFLIFVCHLAAPDGEAREQAEGALAWFSLAEIDQLQASGAIIPSDYVMLKQFAGADRLPFFEADMIAGQADDGGGQPVLHRFEQTS